MDDSPLRGQGRTQTYPLEHVREGMRVIDSTGAEIGKVELVQMGDPDAVTTQGNERDRRGLFELLAESVAPDDVEPDVPEPLRTRLIRKGYIKIDGPDIFDTDRYVEADLVDSVSGDTVKLKVPKDQIPREH